MGDEEADRSGPLDEYSIPRTSRRVGDDRACGHRSRFGGNRQPERQAHREYVKELLRHRYVSCETAVVVDAGDREIVTAVRLSCLAMLALPTAVVRSLDDVIADGDVCHVFANPHDSAGVLVSDDTRERHEVVGVLELVDSQVASTETGKRHFDQGLVGADYRILDVHKFDTAGLAGRLC